MRDDVKIGILLGVLVIVGAFIFWLVQENTGEKSGPQGGPADLTGQPSGPEGARGTPSTPSGGRGALTGTPGRGGPVEMPDSVAIPLRALTKDWVGNPGAGVEPAVPVDLPPPPIAVAQMPPDRPVEDRPGEGSAGVDSAGDAPSGVASGDTRASGGRVAPPAGDVTSGTPAYAALEVAPDGTRLYTVKSGDNAWLLAQRFYGRGVLWTLLRDANPTVTWERNLPIGAKVKVPPPPAAMPRTAGATGGTSQVVGPNEYLVKSGDTLSDIAREKFGRGSLWPKILEVNPGLDEKNLPVGKVIKLPRIQPAPPAPEGASRRAPRTPGLGEYLVKEGDSLWTIAKTQLGSGARANEIYQLNKDVIGPSPDDLKEGMILKLPPRQPGGDTGGASDSSGGEGAGADTAPPAESSSETPGTYTTPLL